MSKLTRTSSASVDDDQKIKIPDKPGPALLKRIGSIEEMTHFDREAISERSSYDKDASGIGALTMADDISEPTEAKMFSTPDAKQVDNPWQRASNVERHLGSIGIAIGTFLMLYLGTIAVILNLPAAH